MREQYSAYAKYVPPFSHNEKKPCENLTLRKQCKNPHSQQIATKNCASLQKLLRNYRQMTSRYVPRFPVHTQACVTDTDAPRCVLRAPLQPTQIQDTPMQAGIAHTRHMSHQIFAHPMHPWYQYPTCATLSDTWSRHILTEPVINHVSQQAMCVRTLTNILRVTIGKALL